MTVKEKYSKFLGVSNALIFNQPWYMDAVSGADGWDVLISEAEDGEILAMLPYYTKKNIL